MIIKAILYLIISEIDKYWLIVYFELIRVININAKV